MEFYQERGGAGTGLEGAYGTKILILRHQQVSKTIEYQKRAIRVMLFGNQEVNPRERDVSGGRGEQKEGVRGLLLFTVNRVTFLPCSAITSVKEKKR